MARSLQLARRDEVMDFYRSFVRLLIPIVIQNLVSSSLYVVDNLMIGRLGPVELAAVSQANQLSAIVNILLFGVISGAAIFASQLWGKRDIPGLRSLLGVALVATCSVGLLGFGVVTFFAEKLLHIYLPNDPKAAALGVQYLHIFRFNYLILAVTMAYSTVNKSTEHVRLPMAAALCSMSINTFLNWCLIFGNLGFPRWGLQGGAVASVAGASTEFAVLLICTYARRLPAAARPRELVSATRTFVLHYIKKAAPVLVNEGFWGIGTSMFFIVFGTMGTNTVAAVSISGTLDRMLYVLIIGVVHASGIIVGKRIGGGDMQGAYDAARRSLITGAVLSVLCAALIIAVRGPIISLFGMPPAVSQLAMQLVLILALAMPLRTFNFINIVGVLRAGGDTLFSMFMDVLGIWLIGVPLVCVAGLVFKLPIIYVFPFIYVEDIVKVIIGIWRFRSRRWLNNLVEET